MTSASDEKWRTFNFFFLSGRAKDLSSPLYELFWTKRGGTCIVTLTVFKKTIFEHSDLHCVRSQQIVYSIGLYFFFLHALIQLHTCGCAPLHRHTPTSCSVKIISGGARNGFVTDAPFIASPSTEVLSQNKTESAGNLDHFETLRVRSTAAVIKNRDILMNKLDHILFRCSKNKVF